MIASPYRDRAMPVLSSIDTVSIRFTSVATLTSTSNDLKKDGAFASPRMGGRARAFSALLRGESQRQSYTRASTQRKRGPPCGPRRIQKRESSRLVLRLDSALLIFKGHLGLVLVL